MNDRSFNREQLKRALATLVSLQDQAAAAEAQGNFTEMDRLDNLASIGVVMLVTNLLSEVEQYKEGKSFVPPGYIAEVLGDKIIEALEGAE